MALLKGQSLAPEVMQLVNARFPNDLWEKWICLFRTCLKMRFIVELKEQYKGNPEEKDEFYKKKT